MTACWEHRPLSTPPHCYLPSDNNDIHECRYCRELPTVLPAVLQNAPHPQCVVTADKWHYPYSRQKAAYPAVRAHAPVHMYCASHITVLWNSMTLHLPHPPCSPGSHPHQSFGQSVEELMITMATPTHSPP